MGGRGGQGRREKGTGEGREEKGRGEEEKGRMGKNGPPFFGSSLRPWSGWLWLLV